MIRPSVLLFALLISLPAWYRLLVDQLDLTQVLIRFLIAVPIAVLLLTAFRLVTSGYGVTEETPATPVEAEPMDPA
ncbi:hypothetical protein [Actinoplanes regularis]|uniref:Uncharacterized protein n=1 Tax=Actinoplanes regularis TaxID=52697 RepID=A0A239GCN7_9ACTN|nr:hypothetical protein [Actinoplanes regularis]GIE90342.1 hypothetical protein Are01nite_68220 [Actinoplanes regularis]SNS66880.1 hypothetical protein SAMN06264365_120133 [Actinoplanes regularis]